MIRYKNKRVRIKEGWFDAGTCGVALGQPVFVQQLWLPVKWDDEEDPTFEKLASIEIIKGARQ